MWDPKRSWAEWGMQHPGRKRGGGVLTKVLGPSGRDGFQEMVGPDSALLACLVAQTASVAVPCLSALGALSYTDPSQLLCAHKEFVKEESTAHFPSAGTLLGTRIGG